MRNKISFPEIIPASDRTILVKFGNQISKNLHKQVFSLIKYLLDNKIDDIVNIHPAYSSVMVSLKNSSKLNEISKLLNDAISKIDANKNYDSKMIEIPVAYGSEYGPDLARVSEHTGLSFSEIIKYHSKKEYLVYFIGFSIGFPYFGGMDNAIATPRLDSPRKIVPEGSIGIAGSQTGIYPLSSPGGWNLIGRTPLKIFNFNNPEESLISMGNTVKFIPITDKEYQNIK